jgi:hypothetical protein
LVKKKTLCLNFPFLTASKLMLYFALRFHTLRKLYFYHEKNVTNARIQQVTPKHLQMVTKARKQSE